MEMVIIILRFYWGLERIKWDSVCECLWEGLLNVCRYFCDIRNFFLIEDVVVLGSIEEVNVVSVF